LSFLTTRDICYSILELVEDSFFINTKRSFSYKKSKGKIKENSPLPSDWITGFFFAEGWFTVIITKRSNFSWRVIVSF